MSYKNKNDYKIKNYIKLSDMIAVRCLTCGKIIANKWETYQSHLKGGMSAKDALDIIGFRRYCCRRMFLTHVSMIDKLLIYDAATDKKTK
jgi:DNA-directed RNA polymerase I, II, and III subunit RPABC5